MFTALHKKLSEPLWANNPTELRRLFIVVGGLSILFILLGAAWGFRVVFTNHVVKMAEADAVAISELMLDFSQDRMLKGTAGIQSVLVTQQDIKQLDHDFAPFVDHMNVTKVKLFDQNNRVVYSTDQTIIGRVDVNNQRLLNALAGNVDTELKEKKTADLRGEAGFTQKVVETYIPIRNQTGRVVGSFEIYLLISKYDQAVRRGILLTTGIMAVVLLGAFAVSYRIINKSVVQVRDSHGQLQQVAITDALTGVANRGYLVLRGKEEFDRALRSRYSDSGKGLGCVLLDLDHFKQINDTGGHLTGDQVLTEFVTRIQHLLRPYDLLGRYGGEEFMVLLPETSPEETCRVAGRMLEAVRELPFVADSLKLRVTVSAGVATSCFEDHGFDGLLKRADDNLYTAKRNGRDQVYCDAPCCQPKL